MRKHEIKTVADFFIKEIPADITSAENAAAKWVVFERHAITTGIKGLLNRVIGKLHTFYEVGAHKVHSELGIVTQTAHETREKAEAYVKGITTLWQSVENVIKSL